MSKEVVAPEVTAWESHLYLIRAATHDSMTGKGSMRNGVEDPFPSSIEYPADLRDCGETPGPGYTRVHATFELPDNDRYLTSHRVRVVAPCAIVTISYCYFYALPELFLFCNSPALTGRFRPTRI